MNWAPFVFAFFLWCSGPAEAQAQEIVKERTIFIGDVEGRVKLEDARIYTRAGWTGVYGEEGKSNFQIVAREKSRLVVVLPAPESSAGPEWVSYRLYPSERALAAAIITGEVDFATLISEEAAAEVQRSLPSVQIRWQRYPPNTVELLAYNCAHPILSDRNVRLAIAHSIDRQTIVRDILQQRADLARGPYNDGGAFSVPAGAEALGYHPRHALQLLRSSGWRDHDRDGILDRRGNDLRFELMYRKGILTDEEVARFVKINLNEVGIDVLPRPQSKADIEKRLQDGSYEAYLGEHRFEEDFESFVGFFLAVPEKGYLNFGNRSFSNYVRLYRISSAPPRGRALVEAIYRILRNEQPATFLYFKWLFYYVVNQRKFENALDERGRLRPFEEWTLRK